MRRGLLLSTASSGGHMNTARPSTLFYQSTAHWHKTVILSEKLAESGSLLWKTTHYFNQCLYRAGASGLFMYQAQLMFWLQINICLAFNSLMLTVPRSHLQHNVVWNCPCELEIVTFTLVGLSQDCRLLPHTKMRPVMDKTMMYWYRSNTVAEQKAPEYSFKMCTWAKINRSYLDDDSDQMPQKTQRLFTAKKNFGSHSTFKQFSSYCSHRVAMDSNYSSL